MLGPNGITSFRFFLFDINNAKDIKNDTIKEKNTELNAPNNP